MGQKYSSRKWKTAGTWRLLKPHSKREVPILNTKNFRYLNNYFNFHVCLSFRACVRVSEDYLRFLQAYRKMSLIKVVWYVLRVKSLHPGSPSHPSQTAAAETKPRCVYSILKPHGQSSRCQVRLLPPRRS